MTNRTRPGVELVTALDDLPLVLFVDDVARLLKTSTRTIARMRRAGTFAIPELPSIDRKARWSREDVRRYLDSTSQRPSVRARRWA